jgi:hypothetical protein
MSRKKGYVGQRKRDGRWFARITIAGKDHIKFGHDKQDAEWLLRCMQLGLDTPRSDVSQAVHARSRNAHDGFALQGLQAAGAGGL